MTSGSRGAVSTLATGQVEARTLEAAADGSIYWIDGDFSARIIHQLAPGAAAPRVIQQTRIRGSVTLLVDGDRLYTAGDEGIFVVTH